MQHKVAVIGAGSYVFTLSLLHDLMLEHQMQGLEIALMDPDLEIAGFMAGIARRMASEAGLAVDVKTTASREEALEGAHFVTSSAAVQLTRRWHMDKEVIRRYGLRETNSECGGVGGVIYALRQVPLILGIARDMERLCPGAWLLNSSNPLPRVMGAVSRYTTIRGIGFCSNSWGAADGYGNVEALVGRGRHDINVVSAGTNHFAWLLSVVDRWTGEDLLPKAQATCGDLAKAGRQIASFGPFCQKCFRQYGALPLSGDGHTAEFLPFDAETLTEGHGHHGTDEERAERRRALAAAAAGTGAWQPLMAHRAWERPAGVIHSLATGVSRRLDMVNLPNIWGAGGKLAIEGLAPDAIVEVPAFVGANGLEPVRVGKLPTKVGEVVARVSLTHGLVTEAAVTGDLGLVREAVESDLSIPDKAAGHSALAELIALHADVLPQFAKR